MLDIKRDNAKFGKSIEHQVNKTDVKTLITRKQYLKYWSFRPTFKREKQFCNGAIAIETEKCIINLNEPLYIGTSILDLSKVLMYDFHYNNIKYKYGDKAEMLLKLGFCYELT